MRSSLLALSQGLHLNARFWAYNVTRPVLLNRTLLEIWNIRLPNISSKYFYINSHASDKLYGIELVKRLSKFKGTHFLQMFVLVKLNSATKL